VTLSPARTWSANSGARLPGSLCSTTLADTNGLRPPVRWISVSADLRSREENQARELPLFGFGLKHWYYFEGPSRPLLACVVAAVHVFVENVFDDIGSV